MNRNIKSIVIEAKRWFDKVNGNTYHSVNVYVNGEFIGRVPYTYGYEEQYLQTAFEILQDAKIYKKSTSKKVIHKNGYDTLEMYEKNKQEYFKYMQDMRDHRGKFIITVADVGRKRDL